MNFAFYHATAELGGAEWQSLILANELISRGHSASIFAFSPGDNTLIERAQGMGIPVLSLPATFSSGKIGKLFSIAKLAARFSRMRDVVLMPYCDIPNLLCGSAALIARHHKCVWNQRGVQLFARNSRLTDFALRGCRLVLSNSNHRAQELIQRCPSIGNRTHVVYNAVFKRICRKSRKSIRMQLGIPEMAIFYFMPGNYVARKNHDLLLQAWSHVLKNWDSLAPPYLLLAGRHEASYASVMKLVGDLGIPSTTIGLLNYYSEVAELIESSDCIVFTGMDEGIPNAVLEAMAHSKPIVAFREPGTVEALGTQLSAMYGLVEYPRVEDLAKAILRIARQPRIFEMLVQVGAKRIETDFSRLALAQKTLGLVELL